MPHASIIGLGLIGGSIALALKESGWEVSGVDQRQETTNAALAQGVISSGGLIPESEITFVATPASAIPQMAGDALRATTGFVTDVGSVKSALVASISDPRFVGGHPMAGSEQDGLAGARADLFVGATWILTPTDLTSPEAFALASNIVGQLGAEVVAVSPAEHDKLMASVSHVPHLVAGALMRAANQSTESNDALLRLAAGGFRDMTRVAAGRPEMWLDVCDENLEQIVAELDSLVEELRELRTIVSDHNRDELRKRLAAARDARISLPARFRRPEDLAEVRVVIADRPGSLAEVMTLATSLDISVADVEIAHSATKAGGTLILIVENAESERLVNALNALGLHASAENL